MTILRTRKREIQEIEEFRILRVRNKRTGIRISNTQPGFKKYKHSNKLPDSKSVSDFVRRFEQAYPGYTCEVGERVSGKVTAAHGNKKLRKVRATY